jgi:hypothetical protein
VRNTHPLQAHVVLDKTSPCQRVRSCGIIGPPWYTSATSATSKSGYHRTCSRCGSKLATLGFSSVFGFAQVQSFWRGFANGLMWILAVFGVFAGVLVIKGFIKPNPNDTWEFSSHFLFFIFIFICVEAFPTMWKALRWRMKGGAARLLVPGALGLASAPLAILGVDILVGVAIQKPKARPPAPVVEGVAYENFRKVNDSLDTAYNIRELRGRNQVYWKKHPHAGSLPHDGFPTEADVVLIMGPPEFELPYNIASKAVIDAHGRKLNLDSIFGPQSFGPAVPDRSVFIGLTSTTIDSVREDMMDSLLIPMVAFFFVLRGSHQLRRSHPDQQYAFRQRCRRLTAQNWLLWAIVRKKKGRFRWVSVW